jgi:hypothetical protein
LTLSPRPLAPEKAAEAADDTAVRMQNLFFTRHRGQLLGWTLIDWIGALVWASTADIE